MEINEGGAISIRTHLAVDEIYRLVGHASIQRVGGEKVLCELTGDVVRSGGFVGVIPRKGRNELIKLVVVTQILNAGRLGIQAVDDECEPQSADGLTPEGQRVAPQLCYELAMMFRECAHRRLSAS